MLPSTMAVSISGGEPSDIIGLTTLCVGASPVSSWRDSQYLLTDDRAQSNDSIAHERTIYISLQENLESNVEALTIERQEH